MWFLVCMGCEYVAQLTLHTDVTVNHHWLLVSQRTVVRVKSCAQFIHPPQQALLWLDLIQWSKPNVLFCWNKVYTHVTLSYSTNVIYIATLAYYLPCVSRWVCEAALWQQTLMYSQLCVLDAAHAWYLHIIHCFFHDVTWHDMTSVCFTCSAVWVPWNLWAYWHVVTRKWSQWNLMLRW